MKKLLVFLAVILLLLPNGVLCAGAASEAPVELTADMGAVEAVQFDPRTVAPVPNGNSGTANRFFGSNADTPHTFYMYLTERQKDVYNGLLAAGLDSADNVNGVEIPFTTPITCQNTTRALTEAAEKELALAVQGGISALMDDHPEMFWLGGYKSSYSYSYYVSGGVYTMSVSSVTCIMAYDTATYADKTAVTDYYNRMMAAFNAFPVKGYTRYEKVKSIHDTIAKQVSYDSNFTNGTAHEPTSVFLEPFKPVCEGYAEAFKMLCDREGIPCIIVVGNANGGGHAWNYVKMEDGNWYAVDLTWDDQPSSIYYDFFLVGANSTNRYFDNDSTTFADAHAATGAHFSNYAMTYPTLSETAYALTLGRVNTDIAVRKADGIVLLGKNQSLSTAFIAPYGSTVSVSGTTTGGTVTVTKDSTVTTYTVARRGDVVVDNAVNKTDYEKVVQATVGAVNITDKAQFAAADLNGDGAVDAFDAALLNMYLNGEELY